MKLESLTADDLLKSFSLIAKEERRVSNEVLLHLLEISRRKLYLERGYPSLFEMLIREYRYSESAAYRRINAMKLLRDVPEASNSLLSGEISLSTASNLQSMLVKKQKLTKVAVTRCEKSALVSLIKGKSQKAAELVLFSTIPELAIQPKESVKRISDKLTQVEFAIDDDLKRKLDRLKELWASKNPNPTWAELISLMADYCLRKVDPLRGRNGNVIYTTKESDKDEGDQRDEGDDSLAVLHCDETESNKSSVDSVNSSEMNNEKSPTVPSAAEELNQSIAVSEKGYSSVRVRREKMPTKSRRNQIQVKSQRRYIPVKARKEVWKSQNGECQFHDQTTNRKCRNRFGLELDHRIPIAHGGKDAFENLQLLCKKHNLLKGSQIKYAELAFNFTQ